MVSKVSLDSVAPLERERLKAHLRNDWTREEVGALFALPFNDLIFKAQQIHRSFFDPNRIQLSTLLNIKTGACPEDCKYCPQSGHYNTGLKTEKLMQVEEVLENARQAKGRGATRFCMGAAWRNPSDRDLPCVLDMVRQVKAMGMETCVTLGMLTSEQCQALAEAGLDYYNHNLDTSPEFYGNIITTRTYSERLDTLANVSDAGINICSGGIVGMGESVNDRVGLLMQLANLPEHPGSVPINLLVRVRGTPLGDLEAMDPFDFVRCVAVARILMPKAHVRLSAGRKQMNAEMHALCYLAGANSIFLGEKLLVTELPDADEDLALLDKLGITAEETSADPEPETLFYDAAG